MQQCAKDKSEYPGTSKIRPKHINYLATFNVNSLLKTGKLKTLTNYLQKSNIMITALQETRYTDENPFDSERFRIYKSKPGKRVMKNVPQFGMGFIVNKKILPSIIEFKSINERIATLTFKAGNKIYTLINVHAPTNEKNRTQKEQTENFWTTLDIIMNRFPD